MQIWRYGDNIDTDTLFPGKYIYSSSTVKEIIPHLLEDFDPNFSKTVKEGDIILAGKNFGCGSSREQPVVGLKAVGIKAIIAKSFARIFYRSAINQGLLLIECPEAVEEYSEGEDIEIDADKGKIVIGSKSFSFQKQPSELIEIRDAGGLLPYTRKKLNNN